MYTIKNIKYKIWSFCFIVQIPTALLEDNNNVTLNKVSVFTLFKYNLQTDTQV